MLSLRDVFVCWASMAAIFYGKRLKRLSQGVVTEERTSYTHADTDEEAYGPYERDYGYQAYGPNIYTASYEDHLDFVFTTIRLPHRAG